MRVGAEAVDKLIHAYPKAHKYFGDHKDVNHFAVTISQHDWLVMEWKFNWVFIHRYLDDWSHGDLHWLCPVGCDMDAIRTMLLYAMDRRGIEKLTGKPPKGHEFERAARMLSRAMGAIKEDDHYLLTRSLIVNYTGKNNPT